MPHILLTKSALILGSYNCIPAPTPLPSPSSLRKKKKHTTSSCLIQFSFTGALEQNPSVGDALNSTTAARDHTQFNLEERWTCKLSKHPETSRHWSSRPSLKEIRKWVLLPGWGLPPSVSPREEPGHPHWPRINTALQGRSPQVPVGAPQGPHASDRTHLPPLRLPPRESPHSWRTPPQAPHPRGGPQ